MGCMDKNTINLNRLALDTLALLTRKHAGQAEASDTLQRLARKWGSV